MQYTLKPMRYIVHVVVVGVVICEQCERPISVFRCREEYSFAYLVPDIAMPLRLCFQFQVSSQTEHYNDLLCADCNSSPFI